MHGSVGWAPAEQMVHRALDQRAHGFHRLKLYAGRDELGADLDRLRRVRDAVGADVPLLLDVNQQWSLETALQALPELESLDIAADEAIYSAADAARIAASNAAGCINAGISKLGGLLRASDACTTAHACGLRILVGSVLELGIATAAGLHLAAAVQTLPLALQNSSIAVPAGPGLGIDVDDGLVSALDARR